MKVIIIPEYFRYIID